MPPLSYIALLYILMHHCVIKNVVQKVKSTYLRMEFSSELGKCHFRDSQYLTNIFRKNDGMHDLGYHKTLLTSPNKFSNLELN